MEIGSFASDDSWLIWGNDGAAIEATGNTEIPAGISSRLNREWQVQETGTVPLALYCCQQYSTSDAVSATVCSRGINLNHTASSLPIMYYKRNNASEISNVTVFTVK